MKRVKRVVIPMLVVTIFLLPLLVGAIALGQLGRVLEVEIGKATNASTQIRIAHQKHFDEKDFSGALVEYQKVTNDYPESDEAPESQFRIGNIYHWNLKDLDKAIDEYQKVTDDYPGTDFAFESLIRQGECYARLKQYNTALACFQSVVSAAPGDGKYVAQAKVNLAGTLLHDLSNHQVAATIYDAILANYPNTEQAAWAHLWKVQIGYINGEYTPAEAVPIYQLIVQSSKYLHVRASAQYMIGYSYYRQGKNAQAIKAFEKVLTDYPASYSDLQAQTLRFTARLERIQGNFDRSKQILREALQKYPTSRWAESIQSALDEFAEMEAATAYGLEHLNDVVLEEETE